MLGRPAVERGVIMIYLYTRDQDVLTRRLYDARLLMQFLDGLLLDQVQMSSLAGTTRGCQKLIDT